MKKKSGKSEYLEMLNFIDSLIDSKEKEIDCLLGSCSDLYHEIRARELLLEEKKKLSGSDSFLFSPNASGDLKQFDNDWLDQLDSLKRLHDEKSELLKLAQEVQNNQKKLKDYLMKNNEDKNNDCVNENVSRETNIQSLEIQEMERNRIANELHDSAVQNLTGLVHKGELCMRLFDIDPIRARMEMSSIIDIARDTIDDIRSSIFELRPASIDDFGLKAAIEDYCNHINPDHKINFYISQEGKEKSLPNIVLVNLYRITQEACINIIKHSNASKAKILIVYTDDKVQLTITDNGVGLPKDVLENKNQKINHFGIRILQERAKLVEGKIILSNLKEGGLNIQVEVPINK